MSTNQDLDIRFVNGARRRFAPNVGELADLQRRPYDDLLSAVLIDMPEDIVPAAVAGDKARWEEGEDKRIAEVKKHHDWIRKNGVKIGIAGHVWHTTHRS